MERSADVVVVGAGPAGALAALVLGRAGHRVILLDRAKFPRPKICGNCLNPRAWRIWDALGLTERFAALPHQQMRGLRINSEGRPAFHYRFKETRLAPRAIAREVFDDWLRHEAQDSGVQFLDQVTVTSADAASGQVETSIGALQARFILAADGRNSVLARQGNLLPAVKRCHRLAWQTTREAPADLTDEIEMDIYRDGYIGCCRFNATQAVVTLVLDHRASLDPLSIAQRRFPGMAATDWRRLSPVARGPAEVGRGRVWLLGDAARVVEPFTGEGIYFALSTGLMAAGFLKQALVQQDGETALRSYRHEHGLFYRRRLWINHLLRWSLTSPERLLRLLRWAQAMPIIPAFLADAVHRE